MANINNEDLTDIELQQKAKNYKNLSFILSIIIVFYGIIMGYLMFIGEWQSGNNPTILLPVFFIFIVVLVNSLRKKVIAEINRRQNK
jgi:hypothetical protein